MEKTIDEHKIEWRFINDPVGKKLGYPQCCIDEFCAQPPEVMKNSVPTESDRVRFEAGCIDGDFTGFIPCAAHANEIISGTITLESLITDRDPGMFPFPFE